MEVFISHTMTDLEVARQIAIFLRDNGLDPWLASESIFPGDNWAEATAKALRESEAMVVVVSQDFLSSSNTMYELSYALGNKHYTNRVFPVLVSSNGKPEPSFDQLPWILRHIRVTPTSAHDLKGQLVELVDTIKRAEVKA